MTDSTLRSLERTRKDLVHAVVRAGLDQPMLGFVRHLSLAGNEIRAAADEEAALLAEAASVAARLMALRSAACEKALRHWSAAEIEDARTRYQESLT